MFTHHVCRQTSNLPLRKSVMDSTVVSGRMEVNVKAKNPKPKKEKVLKPEDIMKYEVAAELGLSEKLARVGWGGLTAEETGRIGGIITRKKKGRSAEKTASSN